MTNTPVFVSPPAKELFKIKATLIAVTEDMAEEIKSRIGDLEDAYFEGLGGSVISKVDTMTLVDTVLRDVIAVIESEAGRAARQAAVEEAFAADSAKEGQPV